MFKQKELFIYIWLTLFQKLTNVIYYNKDGEGYLR